MTAEMWIAATIRNTTYVLPSSQLMDVVNDGDFVLVLTHGIDPQRVANIVVNNGIIPEMRFVNAHRMGRSRTGRPSRPVLCVETGMVYPSVSKAAHAVGATQSNLSNHLRYPDAHKTVKGHTFKFYSGS